MKLISINYVEIEMKEYLFYRVQLKSATEEILLNI